MPPVIPLDDVLLDHETFHESLTSSKMLQLSLTHYSSINHSPSAEMNTFILWYFRVEFSQLSHLCKGRYWHGKKDHPTLQNLPLISLFPYLETQLVASGVHTHLHGGGHSVHH